MYLVNFYLSICCILAMIYLELFIILSNIVYALCLKEEDKEHAMKQLQKQYRNRHHHLYQTDIQNKGRPNDVHLQDWNWLINNKWNDSNFKVKLLPFYIYMLKLNFNFYVLLYYILNYFYI